MKRELKWKLIAGIDKADLVVFRFNQQQQVEELRWEHSKEFEYNGQMYDVVEKIDSGVITIFWCWWDHKETKLNKQLAVLVNNQLGRNTQRKENEKRLIQFLETLFINYNSQLSLYVPYVLTGQLLFHTGQHSFLVADPTSPPPERIYC